jgi:hypothetical protein
VDIRSGYFLSILSLKKTFPLSIENNCNTVLLNSYASRQRDGTSLALSLRHKQIVSHEKKLERRTITAVAIPFVPMVSAAFNDEGERK